MVLMLPRVFGLIFIAVLVQSCDSTPLCLRLAGQKVSTAQQELFDHGYSSGPLSYADPCNPGSFGPWEEVTACGDNTYGTEWTCDAFSFGSDETCGLSRLVGSDTYCAASFWTD